MKTSFEKHKDNKDNVHETIRILLLGIDMQRHYYHANCPFEKLPV
jgi:hypothetical protein